MKVLIIFPQNASIPFNTSAVALAGVVRQAGFPCTAYPVSDGQNIDAVVDDIVRIDPDVICGTFMTRDILGFRSFFSRVKRHSSAVTAVGGYHATIRPRHVAQWEGVDAVGIGEGERALLSLLRARAENARLRTIPGLWVRTPDGFVDPIPPADVEPNITDLPPWDYSVLADPRFKGEAGRHFLVTRAGRACPFACTYCTVPAWETTNGLRNRAFVNVRPVRHLCAELAGLRDRYAPTDIEFWDPQFPFSTDWLADLAELFPLEVGLPLRVLMHVKTLNAQRIELLAKAGCSQLYFGLESGDEEFRRTVLNKPCSDDDVIRTVGAVKAAGISPCAFIMWNLPGETREQAARTIDLVDRAGFDRVRVNCYIPLPGTVLGDAATAEFPDAAVDVFTPLPEWRQEGDANRSAMSDADYQRTRTEFAALQDRYVEQGHVVGLPDDPSRRDRGADPVARLSAERLQRLAALLQKKQPQRRFNLREGFSRPDVLTLVLAVGDGSERRITVRPSSAGGPCYARTEHCLISYEGSAFSSALGEALEQIREHIDGIPFEHL